MTQSGPIRIAGQAEVRGNGELIFMTPKLGSMTMSEAAQWYREASKDIYKVLKNTDLPQDLRLLQAYKLRQTQQQGAVNALHDPANAAEFLSRFNLESLDRTLSNLIQTKGLSGNELFDAAGKKLAEIDPDIRFPDQSGGCFTKGTRVHTREGLKRIEEIQVGDYVLSSPEDGSGKPEYRQVVNTFKHEKKRVFKVGFREPVHNSKLVSVNATGNHPFWVEGLGWTRADELKNDQVLRTADGSRRVVDLVQPIYRTKLEGIGWFAALSTVEEGAWGGCFDYANGTVFEDPNDELM